MMTRISSREYEEIARRQAEGSRYDVKPRPGIPRGRQANSLAQAEQIRRALLEAFRW